MAITDTPPNRKLDYDDAEGFTEAALAADQAAEGERAWKDWMLVGIGLTALVAILAVVMAVVGIAQSSQTQTVTAAAPAAASAKLPAGPAPAPTLAQAAGVKYEKFQPVDPTLPAVPAGPVKKFDVSVIQHVVQVSPGLAPVQAWTYTVNGLAYRGTAASPPMVVNQGDRVQITFRNGSARDGVDMAHSIDVHAAELAPNPNYVDVPAGQQKVITFTAKYAGVFMYDHGHRDPGRRIRRAGAAVDVRRKQRTGNGPAGSGRDARRQARGHVDQGAGRIDQGGQGHLHRFQRGSDDPLVRDHEGAGRPQPGRLRGQAAGLIAAAEPRTVGDRHRDARTR
jgi:hypothetical protein